MVNINSLYTKANKGHNLSEVFGDDFFIRGKKIINQFSILLKTARIHDPNNVALLQPLDSFMNILKSLFKWNNNISLKLKGDFFYLEDVKVKMDIDGFLSFMSVIEEFNRCNIGEIIFHDSITDENIKRFIYLFISIDAKGSHPFNQLDEKIRESNIEGIEIKEKSLEKEYFKDIIRDNKEIAKRTYLKTLNVVTGIMEDIKIQPIVSLKKAKRGVQDLVNQILQEESTLLGLTTLRGYDEYTYNHSVNVCILALAVGQRLGYSKKRLSELGIAALFHDIGKADIPIDILNKPTDFNEKEWHIVRQHPIFGVKNLLRLKGVNELAIRVMTGAFEHHLNYDLSGYPKLATRREITLFGRIISIVDCYDALTSSRVYNRTPLIPEKALKFMLSKSGKAFDPILLKIFINCIGIFPIGSVVLLDTKEIGVIIQANPNPEHSDRPKIKVITDRSGKEIDGEIIDLTETDTQGKFKKNIVKVIDAAIYNIDVSKYFV
ncbi:MAG: HD-GYP domain-containing protein [Nitrospirota bacterium]